MRVAIIGCGLIGGKRANAVREAGAELIGVYDTDNERASQLAGQYGVGVASSLDELLALAPDAVIVATRHDALAGTALQAIEAGCHVLVEKPVARTPDELSPLIVAAEKCGVTVKAGFSHRFHPAFIKAREIVDGGALGPMMFVRGRYGHGGRVAYEKEWRLQRDLSGGGECIDQGSHLIDLARWFLGDLTLKFAETPTFFWDADVEDNCFLALEGEGGTFAWLHAGWTEWKNLFCFEISGRHGKLQIDGLGGSYGTERLTWYRMKPEMGPPDTQTWEFPENGGDRSWGMEFQELVCALEEKREPMGGLQDALAVLGIVEQAYKVTGR